MKQTAAILTKRGPIQLELPDATQEVIPGVEWGLVEAFPTPAYWVYQVLARRLDGLPPEYKVGGTLAEEVGVGLLSGHGIPATVALAAFAQLRERGAFGDIPPSEAQLLEWLKEPIDLDGRKVRYRFAAQKARYLTAALTQVREVPCELKGRQLRDWLLQLPGIGYKTASMIVRNWQRADDVAILDIHIMRVGQVIGLFPMDMTVERHYLALEQRFLDLCAALDLRAAELDALMWYEMASSPAITREMVEYLRDRASEATGQRPAVPVSQPASIG